MAPMTRPPERLMMNDDGTYRIYREQATGTFTIETHDGRRICEDLDTIGTALDARTRQRNLDAANRRGHRPSTW